MAKFTAIFIAAVVALVAGANAAPAAKPCPANGEFCGSELQDVWQCATKDELRAITPPYQEWSEINTNTYLTDANGVPYEAQRACKEHGGCRNADLRRNPPRYATCMIPDQV